ncbi:MAG: hypothetical protein HYW86_04035 [Candidatus Roizmanbacteria bacterium]|nr:MAG: hypothetical protein HYW86_04035 [Candidatus Roizmanbacteria bacterium]
MDQLNSLDIPHVGAAEKAAISNFITKHLKSEIIQDVTIEIHKEKNNPDSCQKIDIIILFKNNN